ncbi:MAG: heme o synthase [Planctomycetes bacterium]|nr:heme o synthase [Planctomycetota bacterium]
MSRIVSILELGKFRLSSLAIFAVVAGLILGAKEVPDWSLILACAFGTLLVAMGGNALNMWIEREHDKDMPRTATRPLPTGRLHPRSALLAGLASGLVGLALLAVWTTWLATALCAVIFVTYVGIYTPLKRRSSLNTIVGAIPGALPPVVGYAAAGHGLDEQAVILFLILFFWQIPHFLSISWRYRDDYAAGGMKMLPVVDPGGRTTTQQMLLYTAALVFVSFLPYGVRMAGEFYLVLAICLNVLFFVIVAIAAIGRFDTAMRQTFLVSIVYLPVLLGVMVLDRTML